MSVDATRVSVADTIMYSSGHESRVRTVDYRVRYRETERSLASPEPTDHQQYTGTAARADSWADSCRSESLTRYPKGSATESLTRPREV